MNTRRGVLAPKSEFQRKSSLGLAVVSLVILPPFAINNFLQGRFLIGLGSIVIITIFALNTWSIFRHNRYYPTLILVGLVPAILFFLTLSLQTQGIIGILWCYPAIISFYFMLPERKAWTANIALLAIALPYAWRVFEHPLAARMIATLFMVSVFSAICIHVIAEQQQTLQVQAVTDPLTGVLNRMRLRDILEQAIEQNHRTSIPMTLITFDLDYFKQINDTLGHDAGDTVLRGVGKLLQERCRRVDTVFRLGGEEFLVLLYNTGLDRGKQVAEALRTAIASLTLIPEYPVTVSLGVASLHSNEDWRDWMKRSDENLYRAKQNGRNRVVA